MSAERIRQLDDAFRTKTTGGKVFLTAGVDALPSDVRAMVIRRVAVFTDFTADKTLMESTISAISRLAGRKVFWKIDYYNPEMQFGSEDPGIHTGRPAC
jgi:hypothetical protein